MDSKKGLWASDKLNKSTQISSKLFQSFCWAFLTLGHFDLQNTKKTAGHPMGYFKPQRPIQTKLTNQWTELKTGLKQLKEQLSKRNKLNSQALGLLGVGLVFRCRKSAKKWPGHFSMKFSKQGYKPRLLAWAYWDQIRAQEQKTRSKSELRLSLGLNSLIVLNWHLLSILTEVF